MPVYLAECDRSTLQQLQNLNNPYRGVTVTFLRPDPRRIRQVALDVHRALGKPHKAVRHSDEVGEDVRSAQAWLTALDMQLLVITDAQAITPAMAGEIARFAADAGVDVAFTVTAGYTERLREVIEDNHHAQRINGRDLTDLINVIVNNAPGPSTPVAVPAFPAVPDRSFFEWRDACRTRLTPDVYETVNDFFLTVARHAAATLTESSTTGDVADVLHDYLTRSDDTNHAIATIRAVQVGAFHKNLRVKVDDHTLITRLPSITLDNIDWTPLAREHRPRYAALAALIGIGLDIETAINITVGDVASDGTQVTVTGQHIPVPAPLTIALHANHHYRTNEGAQPDDPYLTYNTQPLTRKTANIIIRELRTGLHLPIVNRTTRPLELIRATLTVKPITAPTARNTQ